MQVTLAEPQAEPKEGTAGSVAVRHNLEISCAANGNLFYSDDPLRFEFLLYSTDGKPVGTFKQPEIRYEITDFEHFRIASGTLPFASAAALKLAALAPVREHNVRLSALIPDAAAKEVGFGAQGLCRDQSRIF